MSEISMTPVTNDHLGIWGARVVEYTYGGKTVDFQDLMVKITERRAASVESEITPLSKRMDARNKRLNDLGKALADISSLQAKFKSDAKGTDASDDPMKQSTYDILYGLIKDRFDNHGINNERKINKATCEEASQVLKTQIDLLNNASSEDMTRLQGIVDRRDQSYSTATTLMQAIGDTRSALVKNM